MLNAPANLGLEGQPQPVVIGVLGMHRSGTSAVSGLLCEAGAWAGSVEHLMPADLYNRDGYFERRQTMLELDDLLAELGGSWSDPPLGRLTPASLQSTLGRLSQVLHGAVSDTPQGYIALVKDPRLCLFSPLLRAAVPTISVVLCVRHPMDVGRSLGEAQGLDMPTALALWEVYNTLALRGLAGESVEVVEYDRLLSGKPSGGELFCRVTGLSKELTEARGVDAARTEGHSRIGLRRQRSGAEAEHQWLTQGQQELWQHLRALAEDTSPVIEERTYEVSAAALDILALHREHRQLRASQLEAAEQQASMHSQLIDATARNDQLSVRINDLESQLSISLADAKAALEARSVTQARLEELSTGHQSVTAERDRLLHGLRLARDQLVRTRQESASQHAAQLERLTRALAHQLESRVLVSGLRLEIAAMQAQAADLATAQAQAVGELEEAQARLFATKDALEASDAALAAHSIALLERDEERQQLLSAVEQHERTLTAALARADELALQVDQRSSTIRQHEASLSELLRERDQLEAHRDELVTGFLSIMGSESWRVGYALTCPARWLKRLVRRDHGSSSRPETRDDR